MNQLCFQRLATLPIQIHLNATNWIRNLRYCWLSFCCTKNMAAFKSHFWSPSPLDEDRVVVLLAALEWRVCLDPAWGWMEIQSAPHALSTREAERTDCPKLSSLFFSIQFSPHYTAWSYHIQGASSLPRQTSLEAASRMRPEITATLIPKPSRYNEN